MKMKRLFCLTSLLTIGLLLNSFAQDNTKVGLPEGAITRLGKGGINLMRFSPDGTRLAVGTNVAVWVYNVPDGKETALFTGQTGQVNALAFSTDGKMIASGGAANPVIQLWDLDTDSKRSTRSLTGGIYSISALAFSEDNTTLISLDEFSGIVHWDVDTGSKLLNVVTGDSYDTAAFSLEGNTFATANTGDGKIHLWDATIGSRQATLSGHSRLFTEDNPFAGLVSEVFNLPEDLDISVLAFSSGGKILASGSLDKTVKLWNTENPTLLATLRGHEAWVTAIAFSDDGNTIASGTANKVIKLWDVNTRRERATFRGHKNTINALTFSPDGKTLASGSADGTIRFWNPDTAKESAIFTSGHTEWVKAIAFAADNTTLASAAFNGTVQIWNVKTAQELNTFTAGQNDVTERVTFSPDATHFACRGIKTMIAFDPHGSGYRRSNPQGRNKIQLWKIDTGEEVHGPWKDVADWTMTVVAFSPNKKTIAYGNPQEVRLWDINAGLELFRFDTELPFIGKLVFSLDGQRLAMTGTSGALQVWNVETPHESPILAITEKANAMAFSPDGAILAVVSSQEIYLWKLDITKKNEPNVLPGILEGFKHALTFSPDGNILVGSGREHSNFIIKLWDVDTGENLETLSGHTDRIEILVFSHDGKTLASGSEDGTVLLWDWDKIATNREQENKGD